MQLWKTKQAISFYNTNSAHIKCNKNTPDIDIFKDILYYQNHSLNFYKDHKDICFILYYDDIINCTKNTLTNVFNFLNIQCDLSLCKIINNNKVENNIIPHDPMISDNDITLVKDKLSNLINQDSDENLLKLYEVVSKQNLDLLNLIIYL